MNPRILIVDDEAPIRHTLRRLILRNFSGVDVVEASSAEEAIEAARAGAFDIVLTDYRMEGATGADLLRELAATAPRTARVLATGYQEDAFIDEAVAGVPLDGRLAKPWDNEHLIRLLGTLLEARASTSADSATTHARDASRAASATADGGEAPVAHRE